MNPFFDPEPAFAPAGYRCQVASSPWERRAYAALRRRVFCGEQGLMDDDRDAWDDDATPIVAVSLIGGVADRVVGTVRIGERPEPGRAHGVWWGSRLCVDPDVRGRAPIASTLIRTAVCTAHARGATRFLAHVQARNVPLFRRLHWTRQGAVMVCGQPHERMEADLAWYPPRSDTAAFVCRDPRPAGRVA